MTPHHALATERSTVQLALFKQSYHNPSNHVSRSLGSWRKYLNSAVPIVNKSSLGVCVTQTRGPLHGALVAFSKAGGMQSVPSLKPEITHR